jgi:hypothetical protein
VAASLPRSLPEFQRVFPDDVACQGYLEDLRWPDGFVYPTCHHRDEPYRFGTRSSVVLRCRACKTNASLTAGTVMQSSHTKLSTWFWGAYLMMTHTPGISSVQFQRQLGIKRNQTAFQILHKLRSATVRPERNMIGSEWPVEIDECFVGGATRGEGEGVHHKTVVVGAVEVRTRDGGGRANARAHTKRRLYAGRLRLAVAADRSAKSLVPFVTANVVRGARVKTDAADAYNDLCEVHGYNHDVMAMRGDHKAAERHLPIIHRVFSNLKTWLYGTHHGRVEPQHLQAYLNEFVFRFNRRLYPMTAFNSVLGISVRTVSPTYAELYSGKWKHPS